MDQSFFLRAKRLLERQPAAPSHQALLDHLAAQSAASPTVRACAEAPVATDSQNASDPLPALILGEADWHVARRTQRGCFSRAATARRVNRP